MDTRYEMSRNAPEVLRKIYKSIMLYEHPQVKRDGLADRRTRVGFADSVEELARGMSEEERQSFEEEGYQDKLEELGDIEIVIPVL
jgi:hypothetical protein